MASARATLQTVISADATKFHASMRRVGDSAAKAGKAIAKGIALGAAGVAAAGVAAGVAVAAMAKKMAEGVKSALDLGGALSDVSAQTGIAAGNVAVLQRAFADNGIAADKLGAVINKMQKSISDFGLGMTEPTEAFESLGIAFSDIQGLSPEKQFELIAQRISAISNPTERAAAAMRIFGRSGGQLLTLFSDSGALAKATEALGAQAEILNRRSGDFDAASDLLAGAGVKLQGFFVGVADKLVEPLMGVLKEFYQIDLAGIGQRLGESIAPAVEKIGGMIEGMVAGFSTLVEYAARMVETLSSSSISEAFVRLNALLVETAKLVGITLAEYLVKAFSASLKFFSEMWRSVTVKEIATELFNTWIRLFKDLHKAALDAFRGMFADPIEEGGNSMQDAMQTAIDSIDWGMGEQSKAYLEEWKKAFENLFPELPESSGPSPSPQSRIYERELEEQRRRVAEDAARMANPYTNTTDATTFGPPRPPSAEMGPSKSLMNKAPISAAARAASARAAGFRGLGDLYGMQAARASGIAPGTDNVFARDRARLGIASGLQTGGLGAKRRVGRDKSEKKRETLEEKQVSHLEAIENKIGQALTVG
jgi:hypothetical protein